MTAVPWVLGVSASHNGGTCLLHGDEIVVAVQEERLSRWKRHKVFSGHRFLSLRYCLEFAGITVDDLDAVALCSQGHGSAPDNRLENNPDLAHLASRIPFLRLGHHAGHAVSAFATSGMGSAAILVVDGVGSPLDDLSSAERDVVVGEANGHEMLSLYRGVEAAIEPLEKQMVISHLDRSAGGLPKFGTLGMMFGAIAYQLFGNGLEAGKVMGLAPYGKPTYPVADFLETDGDRLVFTNRVCESFRFSERWPAHETEYQNLAASAQVALEEALLWTARRLRTMTGSDRLCYAGGVALNSIANERLIRESGFDEIFIVPAAEDSGPAIGAAYHALWKLTGKNAKRRMGADALGREYGAGEVAAAVASTPGVVYEETLDYIARAAELLVDGKIIGWFQGRSELGPRALGQRSILVDPRRADGKEVLNARIKFREAFRPFAPVILAESAADWFELGDAPRSSPYMLRVVQFRPGKGELVPAVTHVDGSGRLQTVTGSLNRPFYELIRAFAEKTGVPLLLNTSFNVMGEPIVETPEDALASLLLSDLDAVVIGNGIATRAESFDGILSLRPRQTGRRIESSEEPDSADFGEVRRGEYVHFAIDTRWGETTQRVASDFAPILAFIDGKRSGREVHRAMIDSGSSLNEKFVALAISRLRRARIVDFVGDEST